MAGTWQIRATIGRMQGDLHQPILSYLMVLKCHCTMRDTNPLISHPMSYCHWCGLALVCILCESHCLGKEILFTFPQGTATEYQHNQTPSSSNRFSQQGPTVTSHTIHQPQSSQDTGGTQNYTIPLPSSDGLPFRNSTGSRVENVSADVGHGNINTGEGERAPAPMDQNSRPFNYQPETAISEGKQWLWP